MDNEKVIITNDGQIHKSDEEHSPDNVIARVETDDADEAVAYYRKKYTDLEKYVDASIKAISGGAQDNENRKLVDKLKEEIVSSKVIGNKDDLLEKVNALSGGTSAEVENPDEVVTVPSPGISGDASDESVNDKNSLDVGEGAGKPESESTEPESELTEPVEKEEADKERSDPESQTESDPESEPESIAGASIQPGISVTGDNAEKWAELRALANKAVELVKETDWLYVQAELENIRFKWNEIISADESLKMDQAYDVFLKQLEESEKNISDRKSAHQEKRRERKKENMERRDKILEQLQNIVDKKRWQAFKEVGNLTHRWEEIRDLPNEDTVKDQNSKFQQLTDEFNDKKVAYLIKTAQKEEENLVGKLAIIDKLVQITSSVSSESTNWEQLDSNIEELSKQWKKIGHVPMEQSDAIWERFKSIRDEYFNKKYELNKAFRKATTKNIQRKTRLCEKAEALLEEKDLALAVREINILHKHWKKIGPIPKTTNDELWERFNTATKKFNDIKNENQDTIRQQEQVNLDKKIALCEKAESLKENTNWEEVSDEMNALMTSWKEIGPIPRRKAGKLWQRFKNALDAFYNKRRDHFRDIRAEQKENYDKKREIVAELQKLSEHENPGEAVTLAKELQEKYRNIGFVPIKKKSKIASDYKNACDLIYQRARTEGKGGPVKSSAQPRNVKNDGDKAIRAEFFKVKKEYDKIYEELMRYQDTITFINPGGQGNELIEEIQQKIDHAQKAMEEKQEKLEELRREMRE